MVKHFLLVWFHSNLIHSCSMSIQRNMFRIFEILWEVTLKPSFSNQWKLHKKIATAGLYWNSPAILFIYIEYLMKKKVVHKCICILTVVNTDYKTVYIYKFFHHISIMRFTKMVRWYSFVWKNFMLRMISFRSQYTSIVYLIFM